MQTTIPVSYAAMAGGVLLSGLLGAAALHTAGVLGLAPKQCHQPTTAASCPVSSSSSTKPVKVVTVTGAAGQIGYAIIFQIAAGRMLGPDQPIELRLLDVEPAMGLLQGVVMELKDCAFPLLTRIVPTHDLKTAFTDCDIALLIGAKPRGPGMQRKDLLKANLNIFKQQGEALNEHAKRSVKVLVVGNPANTNAKVAMEHAPNLPSTAFTAMTRLDQNRAVAQVADKTNQPVAKISNVIVWGNHSDTQVPDLTFARLGSVNTSSFISSSESWVRGEFMKTVQNRGAAVIDAMKKSSAASAANAAVEHMRDWVLGTRPGEFVSMAVCSNGEYGVPKGLIYSFPCTCANGEYAIVTDLAVSDFTREKMKISADQLQQEAVDANESANA